MPVMLATFAMPDYHSLIGPSVWRGMLGMGAADGCAMTIVRRTAGRPNRTLIGRSGPAASDKNLSLLHVTPAGTLREIVSSGQLEPRPCPTLGHDLLYFFMLRPAYGRKTDDAKSDQVGRFPSCLVIDPDKLGAPYHVYPFDTGGALTGVFGDTPNPTVYLEDYELAPTLADGARHIAWAFGSRHDYFKGDVLEGIEDALPQFDEVARSFIAIARLASSVRNAPDRRASAVEVAYRRTVSLCSHCPLIVLPKQYIEDGPHSNLPLLEELDRQGIEYRVYDWQPNRTPADYRDDLSRLVQDFLFERANLDG